MNYLQSILLSFFVLILPLCFNEVKAQEPLLSYTLPLHKKTNPPGGRDISKDKGGSRTQAKVFISEITEMGLLFEEPIGNIISYEVLEANEEEYYSFCDESSFISTLFTLSGDYQIRFVTDDFVYEGYISIP